MFCPNCGKEVKDSSKFCTNCGYSFQSPTEGKGNAQRMEGGIENRGGSGPARGMAKGTKGALTAAACIVAAAITVVALVWTGVLKLPFLTDTAETAESLQESPASPDFSEDVWESGDSADIPESTGNAENTAGLPEDQEEMQENEEELPAVWSSCMAPYGGLIYCAGYEGLELPEGVDGIVRVPFEPAQYDYICSLAFYGDDLYYSCKDEGTSEYGSAIFRCRPDGSEQELLADSGEGFDCTSFCIIDGVLIHGYDTNLRGIDLETGKRADIPEEYHVEYHEIGAGTVYRNNCRFFVEEEELSTVPGEIYLVIYEKIGYQYPDMPELVTESAGTYTHLQAVTSDAIYYTCYSGNNGCLMKYDLNTEKTTELAAHPAAGGGPDTYFNW
jgi:hypothetical protein